MALGGLIEVLAVPQSVDDGWGLMVDMTHRGYNVTAGVVYGGSNTGPNGQIVAARCEAFLGKIVNGDFKVYALLGTAAFSVQELKDMGNNLSLAAIVTQAKVKLGIT